jgi:hypothetical protein
MNGISRKLLTKPIHMKLTLSLAIASLALVTATSFADDPQLQNRLATQKVAKEQTTTIAVYTHKQAVAQNCGCKEENSAPKFEQRVNAHGQAFTAHTVAP